MKKLLEKEKLSKIQKEVLVGILLGDGSLRSNKAKTRYSLRVLQSEKHGKIQDLYEIFKDFVNLPPKFYSFGDKRNPSKIYSRYYFNTRFLSIFKFYGKIFYPQKKKRVPKQISRFLTSRGLKWYMDDGAQKPKGKTLSVRFCTDNFTLEEVILIGVLESKFDLRATLEKKGKAFRIYIKSSSYKNLKNHIFPFLEKSMTYKFP